MNSSHIKLLLVLGFLLVAAGPSYAAEYYIDYEQGSDEADGLSAKRAWKHAPFDANAGGVPKSTAVKGGDILRFKGGVAYQGTLTIGVSGEAGKPIVLDANADGSFGEGYAILDGGKMIDSWKKVENAEEVGGNERWKEMFYADIDLDISKNFSHGEVVTHRKAPKDKMAPWQRVILCDGNRRLLPIAQHPKPKDDFFPDLPGDFLKTGQKMQVDKSAGITTLKDDTFLDGKAADYFDGMFIGVHGGNNHVYFAKIQKYDPSEKALTFPVFKSKTYNSTKYAIYNHPKLISNKGEWSVKPMDNGQSRFYLLPDRLVDDKPNNIGFPYIASGIVIEKGASHITVDGFLIQRFSGGKGGVSIARNNPRSSGITVKNCEIRFLSGAAGISPNYVDNLLVDNCFIHHCPGWTTAIFLSRINDYEIRNCRLDKNSGSGIRHYESKRGHIHDNVVINHYGMHSSTINMYEGCEDITLENNYLHNVIAINRNAKNLTIRNNVLDSQQKAAFSIAMWQSGRVGGREINNVLIENNTLLNVSSSVTWGATVFVQSGKLKAPVGLVLKNNIIDKVQGPKPAKYESNIYIKADKTDKITGAVVESDFAKLFKDHKKGDFRRKKGGPLLEAGANLPPMPETWQRK